MTITKMQPCLLTHRVNTVMMAGEAKREPAHVGGFLYCIQLQELETN